MSSMKKKYLNSNLFFFLKDKEFILWDFQNHQQFSLTIPYFERLIAHGLEEILEGEEIEELKAIDQDLLKNGILMNQPCPEPLWKWDNLSYIFHIGTRNVVDDFPISKKEWISKYMADCEQAVEEMPKNLIVKREGPLIVLPKPQLERLNQLPFLKILKERQTIRNFEGKPVELEDLSTLLFTTFGLFHGSWNDLSEAGLREVGMRKTSASGGGLHPNEAYVTIHRVSGLAPGIYHYDVEKHALVHVNESISDDQLSVLCMGQPFGDGIAFGVFLVAYFDKVWWKYPHSRGYRVTLLDAGHLSQTFQLVSTSLGILTWMTANIHDVKISQFLKLEGIHQAPIHFLGAGYGCKSGVYKGVKDQELPIHQL
jgi:SagB-type dehydrogenase family enzyme